MAGETSRPFDDELAHMQDKEQSVREAGQVLGVVGSGDDMPPRTACSVAPQEATAAPAYRKDVVVTELLRRFGFIDEPTTHQVGLYDASTDPARQLHTVSGDEDVASVLSRFPQASDDPLRHILGDLEGSQIHTKEFVDKTRGPLSHIIDIDEKPFNRPFRDNSDEYYHEPIISPHIDHSIDSWRLNHLNELPRFSQRDQVFEFDADSDPKQWIDYGRGIETDGYPGSRTLQDLLGRSDDTLPLPSRTSAREQAWLGQIDPALMNSVPSVADPEGWIQGLKIQEMGAAELGAEVMRHLIQVEAQQKPDAR